MSRYTPKFTKAERIAFGIVPETCQDVEAALDRMRKPAPQELIEAELASYRIEYSANLLNCIQAILAKSTNTAVYEVRKAVLFKGTYPLRLALVQQIEATMPGPQPEPEIRKWVRLNNPSHPLIN